MAQTLISSTLSGKVGYSDSALLERLLDLPEGDWHSANHGRAISSKWLAQKLRPYGIVAQRRNTGKVYMMADFGETFWRFLPTQTT